MLSVKIVYIGTQDRPTGNSLVYYPFHTDLKLNKHLNYSIKQVVFTYNRLFYSLSRKFLLLTSSKPADALGETI